MFSSNIINVIYTIAKSFFYLLIIFFLIYILNPLSIPSIKQYINNLLNNNYTSNNSIISNIKYYLSWNNNNNNSQYSTQKYKFII